MSDQADTHSGDVYACCVCGSKLQLSRMKVASSASSETLACDECFPLLLFCKGFVLGYVVRRIIAHCSPIVLCNKQSKGTFFDTPASTPFNKYTRLQTHVLLPTELGITPIQHQDTSYASPSNVTNRVRCRLEAFQDENQIEDDTPQLQILPVSSDDEATLTKSRWHMMHVDCQTPNLLADIKRDDKTELKELNPERSMFTRTGLEPKPPEEAVTVKLFNTHKAKQQYIDVSNGTDHNVAGTSINARLCNDSGKSQSARSRKCTLAVAHFEPFSEPAKNKREKCRFCERWIAKKFLDRHIHYKHQDNVTSTSKKLEKCMHCEAMLNVQNKGNLRRHLQTYHPTEYKSSWKLARVQCKQCHQMVSKCSFSHHMQVNHSSSHPPSHIQTSFAHDNTTLPQGQSGRTELLRTSEAEVKLKSSVNESAVTRPSLHQQKQQHHLKPRHKHHSKNGSDPGRSKMKSKTCLKCGEKFDRELEFTLHMRDAHQYQMFTCKLCSRQYPTQTGLSGHMQSAHNTPNVLECHLCGETFSNFRRTYDLERHKVKVHKLKEHVCHICGKKFSMKKNLKFHLEAHDGIPQYFCEICGKGFLRPSTLHAHRKVHEPREIKGGRGGSRKGESCAVCMAAKVTSIHCSLHGPPKLQGFICQDCGKDFSSSSGLHAHAQQHKAPRFSCEICGKMFTYKCNWKNHLELHAGKTYTCDSCTKTFPTKRHLHSHKKKHTKTINIICPLCCKGLKKKSGLYTHIRTMHPEAAATANGVNSSIKY